MLHRERLVVSPNGMVPASDATTPQTLGVTTMRPARIHPSTPLSYLTRPARVESARLFDSQRKLSLSHIRLGPNRCISSCWDGENLDSPDHATHVSYPAEGTFESNGPCPDTHPVKLPQLMYEVIWDTAPFNDPELWPEDGFQPFYLSFGDK